jgi:exodeoxyribonuclease VII large subunit
MVRTLEENLSRVMAARIDRARLLVKPFSLEDLEYRFRAILQPRLVRFDDAKEALLEALKSRIADLNRRLALARRGLEAASPLAVLERGFSLVLHGETGKAVRRFDQVKPGDPLIIRPLEGLITARTEEVRGPETAPLEG